ncbi:hypothetical protein T492DRAFT_843943 [Pavlovales sp. CCMP2436]|nr:hypothetical protein T492DRAFT_843943 [Pavlovales sp. CCMP2436]
MLIKIEWIIPTPSPPQPHRFAVGSEDGTVHIFEVLLRTHLGQTNRGRLYLYGLTRIGASLRGGAAQEVTYVSKRDLKRVSKKSRCCYIPATEADSHKADSHIIALRRTSRTKMNHIIAGRSTHVAQTVGGAVSQNNPHLETGGGAGPLVVSSLPAWRRQAPLSKGEVEEQAVQAPLSKGEGEEQADEVLFLVIVLKVFLCTKAPDLPAVIT